MSDQLSASSCECQTPKLVAKTDKVASLTPSWSKPQLAARAHARSLEVQKRLLNLFASSSDAPVSLLTPLTYADRLRIRHPGDAKFALGPHMDGGSVERWEDEGYRRVYGEILRGRWEGFDAFQMGE